ncbi:hypothetical protein EGN72_07155 [Pseudorhodobacter sp. E13]|uniref:hypothetical protein n=1 Tax=Pseudorhodobacter sp. E13 TaxID=2487931 RepID=UPI000F8D0269|nr:hypothetical protein [Pseudorhodobacter sp. E13]RUS60943.1 hypothetical protein EGN72_07155 [Pseudorhodobacter sp. E13]
MPQSLSTTIKGVTLPETLVLAALEGIPNHFSKSDFAQALSRAGLPEASDNDLVRRLMQHLKRQGLIHYADDTGTWSLTTMGAMRLPARTLPLTPVPIPTPQVLLGTDTDAISPAAETARLIFSAVACVGLIGALIGLNASFAWELGREARQFQILIMVGLMAIDMMRPGFVLMGFYLLGHRHKLLGAVAVTIALTLSPVSVLSTTSILSSSLLLGAEMNQDAAIQEEIRQTLRAEHARLLDRAAQDEAAWRQECARGGCGPVAREREAEFQRTMIEAQSVLDRVLVLSDDAQGTSELLARLVTTFEGLGLFGDGRQILLPLFLAISLELGALFGPALLLRRRT